MAIPTGYEKLAAIGIAYKGDYTAGTAYKLLSAVYYNGATYVALKDNPVTPPAADGVNWQYLAKGFTDGVLSAIEATDTSGLMGAAGATVGAQALLDVIADKVATKLLAKNQVVNNLLATDPGNVLDACQGKALKDLIDQQNSDYILKCGNATVTFVNNAGIIQHNCGFVTTNYSLMAVSIGSDMLIRYMINVDGNTTSLAVSDCAGHTPTQMNGTRDIAWIAVAPK